MQVEAKINFSAVNLLAENFISREVKEHVVPSSKQVCPPLYFKQNIYFTAVCSKTALTLRKAQMSVNQNIGLVKLFIFYLVILNVNTDLL